MKPKYLTLWGNFALQVAALSQCVRLKVGCVLVSPDGERCLSFGYNGTYRGGPNEYADTMPGDYRFVHAEANSLVKGRPYEPFSAIVTATPCYPCAMLLINAGAQSVYALSEYRNPEGWELLKNVLGDRAILIKTPPKEGIRGEREESGDQGQVSLEQEKELS